MRGHGDWLWQAEGRVVDSWSWCCAANVEEPQEEDEDEEEVEVEASCVSLPGVVRDVRILT